jgi:hypothetical protein
MTYPRRETMTRREMWKAAGVGLAGLAIALTILGLAVLFVAVHQVNQVVQ